MTPLAAWLLARFKGRARRTFITLAVLARLHVAVAVVGGTALLSARKAKVPRAEDVPTLRAPQVADILGVSVSTVTRLCRTGDLPSLRLGRFLVIPTAALRRMLGMDVEEGPDAA